MSDMWPELTPEQIAANRKPKSGIALMFPELNVAQLKLLKQMISEITMSKGISKFQLALTEKKARRVELLAVKEYTDEMFDEPLKHYVIKRIKELDFEILEIEAVLKNPAIIKAEQRIRAGL